MTFSRFRAFWLRSLVPFSGGVLSAPGDRERCSAPVTALRSRAGSALLAGAVAGALVVAPFYGAGAASEGAPTARPAVAPQTEAAPPTPDVRVEALPGSRTPSGQPVPRFVSLRFNVVNLRTGPGKRYPSAWVYRRINLPVEVVAEYDLWRMIRDVDGVTGWVHRSMLSGNRHGLTREGDWIVRRKPEDTSRPLLKVGAGVVIRILKCPEEETVCRVRLGEVEGWIPRSALWGLYPGEVVD